MLTRVLASYWTVGKHRAPTPDTRSRRRLLVPVLALLLTTVPIAILLTESPVPIGTHPPTSPPAELAIGPTDMGDPMVGTTPLHSPARAPTGLRVTRMQLAAIAAALLTASAVTGGALGYANRTHPPQVVAAGSPPVVDAPPATPPPAAPATPRPAPHAPPRAAPVQAAMVVTKPRAVRSVTTTPPVPQPAAVVVKDPTTHHRATTTTTVQTPQATSHHPRTTTITTTPPTPKPTTDPVDTDPTTVVTTKATSEATDTPGPDPSSASPSSASSAETTEADDGRESATATP